MGECDNSIEQLRSVISHCTAQYQHSPWSYCNHGKPLVSCKPLVIMLLHMRSQAADTSEMDHSVSQSGTISPTTKQSLIELNESLLAAGLSGGMPANHRQAHLITNHEKDVSLASLHTPPPSRFFRFPTFSMNHEPILSSDTFEQFMFSECSSNPQFQASSKNQFLLPVTEIKSHPS